MKLSLEKVKFALGFTPEKMEEMPGGITRVLVSFDRFGQVTAHWQALSPESRPRLQAMIPSACENSRLLVNYLIELPGEKNLLCLELDVARDRVIPDLRALWPYCDWWQEELAVFSGARMQGARGKEEALWQQA